MKLSLFILTFLIGFFPFCLYAQSTTPLFLQNQYSRQFSLSLSDTIYQLPHDFLNEGSERVLFDSLTLLQRINQYKIDYRYGQIIFNTRQLDSLLQDTLSHRITVTYRALPLQFKREYTLRHLEVIKDSSGRKKTVIAQSSPKLFSDDFFGPGLQKSGSIIRGFSVGSNRDLSLNSGFRMQLAGKLAQDVNVTAALTDENSPIQPEGTTQTLREVDKVYIEIKHPQYSATLGDFYLQIDQKEGGEFGRMNRKLQGGQGIASFEQIGGSDIDGSVSFTGATARGKYATNQFQGTEGMQGPYRLTSPNGENRLIIVAGSERVYLNGELMTRGEVNDYIIDYASGEVTFASRRLITSASRITIDFEYSDQQFIRNLVAGSAKGKAFGDGLKLNATFTQEADDPDSPVNMSLDDNMRNILKNSGADRFKASISGISFVGQDSTTGFGKGEYILRDTTIIIGQDTNSYSILVYAPGDSLGVYLVTFSPVDRVPDTSAGYVRIAAGQFRFAGIGRGSYLPLQFLPIPKLHQVFDVNGQASLGSDFLLSGEYALSYFNPNRFSSHNSSDLGGNAFTFSAQYNPKRVLIGGENLGEVNLHVLEHFVDRRFLAMDRMNEVEFNRKWNLTETSATADEEIQEFSFTYRPIRSMSGAVVYGALNRPGEVRSTRTQVNFGLADSSLPSAQYQIEKINTSNILLQDESRWTRQRGTMEYEIGSWHPGFRIESEERIVTPMGQDSMRLGSFSFLEIAPRLAIPEFAKMTFSAELQIRTEDSATAGVLNRASHSFTQFYNWQLNNYQLFSSSLTLSIRKVEFTDEFKQRGNLNSDAVLIRSQTRYTPFQRAVETDLYYEFSNQRSARLERIFIRVIKGNGNYRYLGDVNGNGVADENDFELKRFDGDYIVVYIPTDQLYPVADLKASVRLRLQPARLIPFPTNWLSKALRAVSTETYLRVDEKSEETETKQIYLLNFSRFLDGQTTIAGSQQIMQDIFLFENDADLSFRFRYSERYGLTHFISAVERSYIQEQSIRVRSQLVQEIGNQTDFINKRDKVTASSPTTREHDFISNTLLSDFSYRPMMDWEVGFNFNVTEVVDHYGAKNATVNINVEGIRIIKSFPSVGQLRTEFNREEVILNNIVDPPYEMTDGKLAGQTYLWQITFDYRITSNLQLSINYNGRTERGRTTIHFARMEARAFF
jgi:hypothetical protein